MPLAPFAFKANDIEEFRGVADSMHECWSKEALEDVAMRVSKPKAAIGELITLMKGQNGKVMQAIAVARKELEKQKKEADDQKKMAASKSKKARNRSTNTLHDVGAHVAVQVPCARIRASGFVDMGEFPVDQPLLITAGEHHDMFSKDGEFVKQVEMFKFKFEGAKKAKLDKGRSAIGDFRAQRSLPKEVVASSVDAIDKLLVVPDRIPDKVLPATLLDATTPTVYGIESDYSNASNEKEHLSTLRVCFSGTRSVLMTPTLALSQHIRNADREDVINTLGKLTSVFHKFNADEVKAYAMRCPLFAVTVAPFEALYIPAGFTCSEVVSLDKDHFGLRRSWLRAPDLKSLSDLCIELTVVTGKRPPTHDALEEVSKAIASEAGDIGAASDAKSPGEKSPGEIAGEGAELEAAPAAPAEANAEAEAPQEDDTS